MSKTPIMLLQELMIKQGCIPIYDHMGMQNNGTCDQFLCKVSCKDLNANGTGRTKKEAKQNAAQEILTLLAAQNIPGLSLSLVTDKLEKSELTKPHETTSGSITQINSVFVNYIGQLQEFCMQGKLPFPLYDVEESGPPHLRIFLAKVSIGSLCENGTAHCKKNAKQEAAKNLLQRLTNADKFLQETVDNKETKYKEQIDGLQELGIKLSDIKISEPESVVDLSTRAKSHYIKSKHKITKVCQNITVKDSHFSFKHMYSNRISDDLRKDLQIIHNTQVSQDNYQGSLIRKARQNIQNALELKLEEVLTNSSTADCMICLRLLTVPVITQFGFGKTKDEAEARAMYNIITAILVLLE